MKRLVVLLVVVALLALVVVPAFAAPSKTGQFCSGYVTIYRETPSKYVICYNDLSGIEWTMVCRQQIVVTPFNDGYTVSCVK